MCIRIFFVISLLVFGLTTMGCHGTDTTTLPAGAEPSANPASASPSPQTEFQRDLQYIRNSQFQHVWLISRKDGKKLDSSDSNFLKQNAPQVIDWVATDGGTKVFAGTNFDLEQAGLGTIRKRFVVEDYTGK
ncbi:MAG TPA: hypothetical protein VGN86_10695 [Pyrinomonadaceae bacterium]|jgi:hypothetical protein|nr:hypothetical protein [Pyrinomonadaceae bacterium]